MENPGLSKIDKQEQRNEAKEYHVKKTYNNGAIPKYRIPDNIKYGQALQKHFHHKRKQG